MFAHGEEASPSAQSTPSASPTVSNDESCHELQDYLKDLVKKFDEWKIVVVPRSKNDSRIALTAWGRIDKFNPSTGSGQVLRQEDKERIEKFVKAFRDKGPEQTPD